MSWRGQSSSGRGNRDSRGERGSSRGDRGRSSSHGGRGAGSSRGGQGESPSRSGDRGSGNFRGDRGDRWVRGEGRGRFRGVYPQGPSQGSAQGLMAYGVDTDIPNPDDEVQATEDAIQGSSFEPPAGDLIDLNPLKLSGRTALRPGYGTKGSPVTVWANHFRMENIRSAKVYRYHIKISPEPQTLKRKARLIQQLITEGHVARLHPGLATDYRMLLYAKEELAAEDIAEEIIHKAELEDTPLPNAKVFQFNLQHTGTLDPSDLMGYIRSRDARATLEQLGDWLQALNIIVDHDAKAKPNGVTMSVGANKHFKLVGQASEHKDIGGGLIAWRGFLTSIRNGASGITLNLQVKHAPVYAEGPLPMLMDAFKNANGPNLAHLETFLKFVMVQTDHLPEKRNRQGSVIPRIKSILGLASPDQGADLDNPPIVGRHGAGPEEVEFFCLDKPKKSTQGRDTSEEGSGESIAATEPPDGYYLTVWEHFRTRYQRQVDRRYPVVNVGTVQKPSYLPADVCFVVAGQPARKKLSAAQTKDMLTFAVRKPHLNASSIVDKGTADVGTNPQNPTLQDFGISFGDKLMTVPARILTGPNVLYNNNVEARTQFGSWNMNQIKFSSGTRLRNWSFVLVNDGSRMSWDSVNITVREFGNELRRIGVASETPLGGPGYTIDISQNMTIDDGFEKASRSQRRPELLLFILPSAETSTYNRIKYLGDVKFGIHTVCVNYYKFTRQKGPSWDLQYFANVALKFNLKLGGANQRLEQSKLGIIGEGKTMLVGIDVTHPTKDSTSNSMSISGMVASVNSLCSQFPAVLKFQAKQEDIVTQLKPMLVTRLELWRKNNNNALPENILVYRDGISEGQFDKVMNTEIPSMKEACAELYPATMTQKGLPKLTVLICGKRHNTRFYPSTTQAGKIDVRSGNNPNGTVVDRGVTDPRIWDFYLQAHTAIQGTARPAHYYVIHDEIFDTYKLSRVDQLQNCQNKHDVLETLTHNLSYLYGRATKAVSICPPAYYADLVCERSRCYLADFFEPDSGDFGPDTVFDSEGLPVPNSDLIQIHENLKDSMFYI